MLRKKIKNLSEKLLSDKIEYLILLVAEFASRTKISEAISGLMEERGLSMKDAFDAVYTSRLFEIFSNPKTGLYFQPSGYVYSFLIEEIG